MKPYFSALPLLLAACSSTPPVDYCLEAAAHEASITLGTGADSFEAIEEGALLTPYWGPQGGHHIWASFQATGINPGQGEMVPEHTGMLDGGSTPLIAEGDDPVMITLEVSLPDQEIGPYQGTYTLFASGDTSASSVTGLTAIIDLYGLIEHRGSFNGGHYVAFVRLAQQWFRMSDSTVSEVKEAEVLAKQAFMLFYEREAA